MILSEALKLCEVEAAFEPDRNIIAAIRYIDVSYALKLGVELSNTERLTVICMHLDRGYYVVALPTFGIVRRFTSEHELFSDLVLDKNDWEVCTV